jgi:hypothetical protein
VKVSINDVHSILEVVFSTTSDRKLGKELEFVSDMSNINQD